MIPSASPSASYADTVASVHETIRPFIRRTPLIFSEECSTQHGCSVFFKLENQQVTGSFKARGAFSKITRLSDTERARGLCTASGGNHGLAVCYAARTFGIPVQVFLPTNTPPYKMNKIRTAGGTVEVVGDAWDEANEYAMRIATEQELTYIHAFNDEEVMAGQATIAYEIFDENPAIDIVICSIGGGGLISGVARYVRSKKPQAHVFGVETIGADSMFQASAAGHPIALPGITSIAESLGAKCVTDLTFGYVHTYVDGLCRVTDDAAMHALLTILQEEKQLVEPAASCSLAALETGQVPDIAGKNVAVILCGGNFPIEKLSRYLP